MPLPFCKLKVVLDPTVPTLKLLPFNCVIPTIPVIFTLSPVTRFEALSTVTTAGLALVIAVMFFAVSVMIPPSL